MKKLPNLKITAAVAIAAAAVFIFALIAAPAPELNFDPAITDPMPIETPVPTTTPVLDPTSVDAKNLYTFECELTTRKPKRLYQTCADGGILVYDIKWKSWSPYGAEGTGYFSRNLCVPECAAGNRIGTDVNILLHNLVQYKGKYYLTELEVTPINPDKVPANLDLSGWDVSEFAVMMNWDVAE